MKISKHFRNYWLVLFFLLLLSSCQSQRSPADVKEDVREVIAESKENSAVNFTLRNGIVRLTGQCEGKGCAQALKHKVESVDGVLAVEVSVTEGKPVNAAGGKGSSEGY